MFWLIFLGALALQFAGYALYRSYANAGARLQRERDAAMTRPARTLGAYVGGHDRLGE